jgi:TonB family protein
MAQAISLPSGRWGLDGAAGELLSVTVGVVATLGLFYAISQFKGKHTEPLPVIEDLRAMTLPPEAPPKITVEAAPVEFALPFAGLEVAASDSAVKIAVMPPDLDSLVPKTKIPPSAVIQTTQLFPEMKPKMNVSADFRHVYQASEVDQRAAALSRPEPRWPRGVAKDIHTLRVTFLLIVNTNGSAENIRLMKASGNEDFDHEVEAQIRDEWVFTPAMKGGRKVRQLVQQLITVSSSSSSPYTL